MLKLFKKNAPETEKLQLSAEFKRDYIALAATLAFFLIVISEVTLAISIPMYLYRENSMAYQVARLQLLSHFDGIRNKIKNINAKSDAAEAELQIIRWNMNSLADYLRAESENLTFDEVKELQKILTENDRFIEKIRSGKSFSKANKLDTSRYIDSLIPKREVKNAEK